MVLLAPPSALDAGSMEPVNNTLSYCFSMCVVS